MAKVLRTIAIVAGAVALVATGIGAAVGPGTFLGVAGSTFSTIGTIAGVVAGAAGIGARLLTKPPPARGSVTETIIEIDPPSPYAMGEGYFAGVMRHRVGYGPTLKKVPNPFLFEAVALSVAGPIAGPITPQVDFGPVTSYYSGWLATDTRLGTRPDTALTAPLQANPPGWSTNHKLSGTPAIAWNHKFDKEGEIYASGLPTRGVLAKWVLVYDPRKDSTRPGGSGPHRLGNEATYEWSENPALHAATYAFGRYVNGKRVMGVGLPDEGIDWEGVAAWANDCDANGWRMFGVVFEGAQDDAQRRWQNLRDICIAGGGEPLFSGAVLGFHWQRPRVPLDTVTEADLADGPQEVTAMQSWRDRLNTLRPRYTSPNHNWSLVQAEQVQVASYLAEDGEERAEDIPFNFVKDVDQAAQLAAYWLTNSRELTPITLTLMPRLRAYRPGECLRLELPELGLDHDAVILRRQFDPATMTVQLTLVTEDSAKHAFALGRTGVAPPTPSLTNSAADRDEIARAARAPFWPEVDGPGRPADDATRNVARGTYDAGTTYTRGDEVIFSGSSYRLIVDTSTGNAPPDVARWALIANAGSGPPGADGLPGISVLVSNEAHVVATAADGSGGDYSAAGGTMRLLRGDTVLTPTFSIAAQTPASPSWISINGSTGVYTVSDPGVDLATATLRASWAGVNYDRTYTLAKSKQGVTGPRLALVADNQAFTFTDGAANPGSQTITLTALLNNLSGTATWSTTPAVTLGGTGNTRTLSVANFGSNRQVTIEATLGGITDRITLVRIDRDVIVGNANRVPFSRREAGRGWGVLQSSFASVSSLFNATDNGLLFIAIDATASTFDQNVFLGNTIRFPVIPGERLSVSSTFRISAESGPAPNFWRFDIEWFNAAGTSLGVSAIATGAGAAINLYRAAFVTVPADAQSARLSLRAESAGAGTLTVRMASPMVTSAAAEQAVHPAFSPGPNAVDGALPNNLITVDGGGNLSGIGTANINVDNRRAALQGLASARPASGQFIGQEYHATDTGTISQWDGFNWRTSADITAAAQITFTTPPPFQIQADSSGVTTTDLATQQRSITLLRGGVAQTSGVTVGTPTANPSAAISVASATVSGGIVTVTLATANASGTVTIPIIFGGVTYPVTIPVNRTIAPPPSGGSGDTLFSDGSWANINTTTYTQVTDSGATVRSTTGGQLSFGFSAQYNGGNVQCKAQYSLDGTTWSDVAGTETTGTGGITVPGEEEPGSISRAPVTQSSLSASTLYFVRLVARRTGGTGTISWISPVFTARQP